jgi:hypothetical protein
LPYAVCLCVALARCFGPLLPTCARPVAMLRSSAWESLNPRVGGCVLGITGATVPARGKGTDAHRAPLHLDQNL